MKVRGSGFKVHFTAQIKTVSLLQDPAERDFVVSLLSLHDLSLPPVPRALRPEPRALRPVLGRVPLAILPPWRMRSRIPVSYGMRDLIVGGGTKGGMRRGIPS